MIILNFEFINFFSDCRIKLGEKQYTDAFNDELESFKERVRKRAQVRLEEAMKEVEEVCANRENHELSKGGSLQVMPKWNFELNN